MQKGAIKIFFAFVLIFIFSSIFPFAQNDTYSIDPNGNNAPQEIKDLNLSFRINQTDITAPTILMNNDGTLGFVNYITSSDADGSGYVLVFNPLSSDPAGQFVKAIKVGKIPALMFFNHAHTEIWVVNLGSFGVSHNTPCSISVLDTNSLEVSHTIQLPDAKFGFGSNIVFSPDDAFAYISSTLTDEILKIDTSQYEVADRLHIEVDPSQQYYYFSVGPAWLTMSNDGTFICSTNTFNNTVSVIDLSTFTETHQVLFRTGPVASNEHYPNFTFRNNVFLSEDGTLGLIGSVGSSQSFLIPDRVYEFDPQTGEKIQDADGKDVYLSVQDNPADIRLDPTGEYLIVKVSSYDHIDATGTQFYGFPSLYIYKWPTLELYKVQQFKSPQFNMAATTQYDFSPNDIGGYDILIPTFSTYSQTSTDQDREGVLRISMKLHQATTGFDSLGDSSVREVPVSLAFIPGSGRFVVADFLTGTLVVSMPPVEDFFNVAFSVFIEEGHFSSIELLNPTDSDITYQFQSIQTNNTSYNDDDNDAGLPFYWVDSDGVATFIDPYDFTIKAGQQYVDMYQNLIPDYDKVVNQHGFLKAVNHDEPLWGLVYNGVYGDNGDIVKGDYIKIGSPMHQDEFFPFSMSSGNIQTVLHYVNPYYNQNRIERIIYAPDGSVFSGGDAQFTIGASTGIDQVIPDTPSGGYIRVFNLDNLKTNVYMTVESLKDDSPYFFSCPPLDIDVPTKTSKIYIPYFAVGNGYDTSVNIVSFSPLYDPDIVDDNGDPIPQKTHIKMDFYDTDGNYISSSEFDFNNQSRFYKYISENDMLNKDRYGNEVFTGSIVITVDRDYVNGVFSYSRWIKKDNSDDPDNPIELIQDKTVAKLDMSRDLSENILFPFTIDIKPFLSSYALYNPNDSEAVVQLNVYDTEGILVAQSSNDISIAPHATKVFYLNDATIFDSPLIQDGFVGYMRVLSKNGVKIIGESVQSSSHMLSIIPTL